MKSRIKMMDLNQTSIWLEFHVFIFGFATATTHCDKFWVSMTSFFASQRLNVSQDVLTEIFCWFLHFLTFRFPFPVRKEWRSDFDFFCEKTVLRMWSFSFGGKTSQSWKKQALEQYISNDKKYVYNLIRPQIDWDHPFLKYVGIF